jgi:hypothetical protein
MNRLYCGDNFDRRVLVRRLFQGTVFVILAMATTPMSMAEAQSSETIGIDTFSIRMETDKAAYRLGEPIKVRLMIHNNSGQTYRLSALAPWGMFRLEILDGQGDPLPSKGLTVGYRMSPTDLRRYPPGTTHTLTFAEPADSSTVGEWAPIDYWGYRLTEPGSYTLIAIPNNHLAVTLDAGGYFFSFSNQNQSNAVSIKVSE